MVAHVECTREEDRLRACARQADLVDAACQAVGVGAARRTWRLADDGGHRGRHAGDVGAGRGDVDVHRAFDGLALDDAHAGVRGHRVVVGIGDLQQVVHRPGSGQSDDRVARGVLGAHRRRAEFRAGGGVADIPGRRRVHRVEVFGRAFVALGARIALHVTFSIEREGRRVRDGIHESRLWRAQVQGLGDIVAAARRQGDGGTGEEGESGKSVHRTAFFGGGGCGFARSSRTARAMAWNASSLRDRKCVETGARVASRGSTSGRLPAGSRPASGRSAGISV